MAVDKTNLNNVKNDVKCIEEEFICKYSRLFLKLKASDIL